MATTQTSKTRFLQTCKYECRAKEASAGIENVFYLPRISMTDPVLSSFAGRNPPNPVLAVTSGRLELEFDPEIIEI